MSVYSAVLDRFDLLSRRTWALRGRTQGLTHPLGIAAADFAALSIVVAATAGLFHPPRTAVVGGLATGAVLIAGIAARGGYRRPPWDVFGYEPRALLSGILLAVAGAVTLSYLGVVVIPPALLLAAIGVSVATAVLLRAVHQLLIRHLNREGALNRRVIVIGAADSFDAIRALLRQRGDAVTMLGRCGPASGTDDEDVLGGALEASGLARQLDADTVLVAAGALNAGELRQLGWRLETLRVNLLVVPDVTEVASHRLELVPMQGTPMIRILLGPSRLTLVLKAVMDRCLGLILGVLAMPALLPAMVIVKATSPGKVFFRQTRVGEDGVPFTMLKLRTMYVDAEERLAQLADQSDGNGVLFKMRRDPRVTPPGRILRRFSIDELPQIWNVIRGDMSLVGPRPPLPREVAKYDDRAYHRLFAKPGLTGLWQVSGRSDLDWDESIQLDLRYVDNRTVRTDLKILARTAGAVVGGRGAY